jgi:hypothetical protein
VAASLLERYSPEAGAWDWPVRFCDTMSVIQMDFLPVTDMVADKYVLENRARAGIWLATFGLVSKATLSIR